MMTGLDSAHYILTIDIETFCKPESLLQCKHTLTTESLFSSAMYKSLHSVPEPLRPPNRAALFFSNAVSVKLKHGAGACPVTSGELHKSGGDGIIYKKFLTLNKKFIVYIAVTIVS